MLLPRVDQDGCMVVPVQKDERLFAQNDKNRIAQFGHFGQYEHSGPKSGYFVIFDITVEIIKMNFKFGVFF